MHVLNVCMFLSLPLCVCVSVCLLVCLLLYILFFIDLSVFISIFSSVYPSVCLSVSVSGLFLSVYICVLFILCLLNSACPCLSLLPPDWYTTKHSTPEEGRHWEDCKAGGQGAEPGGGDGQTEGGEGGAGAATWAPGPQGRLWPHQD